MATLVGHEHRWTVIVEMPSVIVSIYCKRPAACLPSHRAIEVGESHILVVLPAVQDILWQPRVKDSDYFAQYKEKRGKFGKLQKKVSNLKV